MPFSQDCPFGCCWKSIGTITSNWLRAPRRRSYTSSLPMAVSPLVLTLVVHTVSFSGNAFSVKNARGKLRSPIGHAARSAQKVRR